MSPRRWKVQWPGSVSLLAVLVLGAFLASGAIGPGTTHAQGFLPAVNLGPVVNTDQTEKAQYISSDGDTLYFVHPTPMGDKNIYFAVRNGTGWDPPVDLGVPPNSPQDDWGPALTADRSRLYFASNRPGGHGSYDIYVSERMGGVWQPPVNLGPPVNTSGGELGQDISADGTVLWFARGWPEGSPTDEDIFYSEHAEGAWTEPVPWEWNTIHLEDNPNISADGTRLYFTAIYDTLYGGGYGTFDIWVSEKVGGNWQMPVNLGPNVNTEFHDANPSISADGQVLYFTSGGRPDGYGGFDLYSSAHDETSGVEKPEGEQSCSGLLLVQSHPNPFNAGTVLRFDLIRPARVELQVFDMGGRLVRDFGAGWREAGSQRVRWDGRDYRGEPVASGVYLARLRLDGRDISTKMIVTK